MTHSVSDPPQDDVNLAHYVLAAGQAHPDKIALAVLGPAKAERWSYGRLTAGVAGAAEALRRRGIGPGDRVLLRIGNEPVFALAFLGAAAVGALPVPTSAELTEPEITEMAEGLAPKLVIAAPGPALPRHDAPVAEAAELLETKGPETPEYHMGAAERPGYIVFTSGTSGRARAVVHAHRTILARRMMFDGWYGLTPQDRVLHAGAFNWTYTLGTGLLDPWTMGATTLIPAQGLDRGALPLLMKRHDTTIFAAAPGVYRQLLKSDLPSLPKLRHGLSAGEKLPQQTRSAWEAQTGTPIHEAYGMSECSTFISASPARAAPEGTLGYPQTGRRVAIRVAGRMAETDEAGTIAIHADEPGLMLGYLDGSDRDSRDGPWFLTGDSGSMAADGAVTYLGRTDDVITAGGYRVSPLEIEAAALSFDGIEEAAACELRVKADATVVGLFYVGGAVDVDRLEAHLCQRLAVYKRPRVIVAKDSLPRSANGKLLRQRLRQDWDAANLETTNGYA